MRSILLLLLSPVLACTVEGQGPHEAPANAPSSITITDSAEPGTRMTVSGRVLSTDDRPVAGARGHHRVRLRHGVTTVTAGERMTLGVVYHDAR